MRHPAPLIALLLATTLSAAAGAAPPKAPAESPSQQALLALHPKDLLGRDVPSLQREAQEAYLAHRYADAARLYVELVRLDPANAVSLYNLACMYARLGAAEPSAEFLYEAWNAGFRDLDILRRDHDFDGVRGTKPFRALLAQLEKEAKALPSLVGTPLDIAVKSAATVRVITPPGLSKAHPRPLVVALHGMGGEAQLFARLLAEARAGTPAVWAFPQAPYPLHVTRGLGYSWFRLDEDGNVDPVTRDLSEAYVLDVVRTLTADGTVDPARVYVVGFSQGGFLAYDLALRHPEIFRGAAPIGGWVEDARLPDLAPRTKTLRLLILHSKNDPAVPWRQAEAAQAFLTRHEVPFRLQTYPGGHAVTPAVAQAVARWLAEDTRTP